MKPMMKRTRLHTATAAGLLTLGVLAGVQRGRQVAAPPGAPVEVPGILSSATPAVAVAWMAPEDPRVAGLDAAPLLRAVGSVEAQVERGAFPGAALAIGKGGRLALERGIGEVSWDGGRVDPVETVYDIASLTKVVATTTAVMLLVEDGRMELDAPVSKYLPEFSGGAKDRVLVRHLLTHTSGLPSWASAWGSPDEARRRVVGTPLERRPGTRVEYSDVGFVALWAAAERAADRPLPELLEERVFRPLGMASTTFHPEPGCEECAPTGRRSGGEEIRGRVHDPIAAKVGGDRAGNAGLFSTARDLARFAAMLANGGELDGVRVLQEETVREFTTRQVGAGTRALGWDTRNERGVGAAGLGMSPGAFGHTGFTGTSLWVDPERRTWAVLLTNRTYAPRAKVQIQALRRRVHDGMAKAADVMEEVRLGD